MKSIKISISNLDLTQRTETDYCLGNWCTLNRGSAILPHPITNNKILIEWANYVNLLSTQVVGDTAKYLNSYYGINFSERFWNISLTPFIYQWISSNYYKYQCIEALMNKKEFQGVNFQFYFLSENSCNITYSSVDQYLDLAKEDLLTHAEFQKIIKFKMKNIEVTLLPEFDNRSQVSPPQLKTKVANLFRHLVSYGGSYFLGNVYGLTISNKMQLHLHNPLRYMNHFFINLLQLPFVKKWNAIAPKKAYSPLNSYDLELNSQNDFEKFVSQNILASLPTEIMTGIPAQPFFKRVDTWIANLEYENQKKIFHVARIVENGGKWLSAQHGGCYGQVYPFTLSCVEYSLTDYFISWGWIKHADYKINAIPLSSPLLSKLPQYKYNQQDKILLIGTTAPIIPSRLDSYINVSSLLEYKKSQLNFFKNISTTISDKLIFRDYPTKEDPFPELSEYLKMHNINRSPHKATDEALNCRIAVVDHCGTTILQLMVMNIPSVFYWNKNVNNLSADSMEDFLELSKLGIWHESELTAAEFINNNYDKIWQWWNSEEVINAKAKFINKYAKNSPRFLDEWKDLLDSNYIKKAKA